MTRPADQRKQSDLRSAGRASRQLQRQAWDLEARDAQEAELAARTSRLRALRLAKEAADKLKAAGQAAVNERQSKT